MQVKLRDMKAALQTVTFNPIGKTNLDSMQESNPAKGDLTILIDRWRNNTPGCDDN